MSRITKNAGRFVSSDEAGKFVGAYEERKRAQGIPDAERVRSEFFGIDNIQQLLAKPGCAGIRIYHAKRRENSLGTPDEKGNLRPRVVLVAVDAEGNELVDKHDTGLKDMPVQKSGSYLAEGPVCPPDCTKTRT